MSTPIHNPNKQTGSHSHRIVSPKDWTAARRRLLEKEKEWTRLRDELSALRRELPWVRVEKDYVFDSPQGPVPLADLFLGRQQLAVYHFMFGPDWQEGCPSCSFVSDHFDATLPHLAARDVALAAVSRAPLAKIEAFKKRMDWKFTWVSSSGSDFNRDFHVSFSPEEIKNKIYYNYGLEDFPSTEGPGLSVFFKDDEGAIYHTYSVYARGLEPLMATYSLLDLMPKGRDEKHFDFPMAWVRYHDRYESNEFADADKPYWPETSSPSSCGCDSAGKKT